LITASPVNLLLVDNEPDSLELLQEFLAGPGVDFTLASSGLQALDNIETLDFAVIVLDLRMPGISGFELAKRIRNCERSKSTPIIFVTGADPRAFPIEQAYALGAVDYLSKPVNPIILRAKVAVFIELYRNMVRKHHEIEREHLLREVQAANERLAEADRRKTEFLATLAHELRNPLAPITAGLAMVRLQTDPAQATQTLDMVERQVNQMVILVDDLLDIARISGGKLELKKDLVELKAIVSVAIETSQPHIQEKDHALRVQMTEEALVLEADPTRIAQVIANLLNNAAKYTPSGGRIDLSVHRENAKNDANGEVVISVADNGIGLAQDSLDKIFEMFSQADLSANRANGGLGIGLALVRQLVEMHGGAVSAASLGIGQGSTFTVRLPLASRKALPAVNQKRSGDKPPSSSKQLRILVVDDHVDAAKALATVLAFKGHVVEVAHSGLSALSMAAEFRPDVAFLDIGMPGMDGYETARAVRKIAGLAAVRLVALTGWGTKADRARSTAAGFDHHLTKPAALDAVDVLLAKIADALQ
jgi:signal transduction histidine kinase